MTPLGSLLQSWTDVWVWLGVALVQWWAIWFTLGRNFSTTSALLLVSKGISTAGVFMLLCSGAVMVETDASQILDSTSPWAMMASGLAVCIATLGIEATLLRSFMRRKQPSWSWNLYDLRVLATVHALHVSLAAWLS